MEIEISPDKYKKMERKVKREMREYVQKYRSEYELRWQPARQTLKHFLTSARWDYFNNFHQYFPDSDGTDGYFRTFIKGLGAWNTINRKVLSGNPSEDLSNYSELFLSQTSYQFFEIFDRVWRKERIPVDLLSEARDNFRIRYWYPLAFPAYVDLRVLGYKHKELTI